MEATIQMPAGRRLALTIVVMVATLLQVLDSTIANVALPHMEAALGAAPDTISWVLTSYIIGAAIATPLTGWIDARIGRRTLMAVAVGGFTITSAVCGVANSLQMMVAARFAQGLFGAFISPLSQSIMLDIYPYRERPKAMSIWGMGVMVGPILGPLIGGILTDAYSWRWVFFVNLPLGLAALVGIFALLPQTRLTKPNFDMVGFAFLALALGSLQLVLDRGTQLDWLSSTEIIVELCVFAATLWMFITHTITARDPLIPVALFRDRNFVIANLFILIVMGVVMAGAALVPPMVQSLFGHDTTGAGMLMMPRGVATMVSMIVAAKLATRLDPRVLLAIGMLLIGSAQWMMTGFSLEMDSRPIIVTGLVQGLGFGFVMVPLNLMAFATIAPKLRTTAASVWSLSRNIGGSITISLFSALLAHNLQVAHSDLAGEIGATRFPILQGGFAEIVGMNTTTALQFLDAEINRQAMMISYLDDFLLMALATFILLPFTLAMKMSKTRPSADHAMVLE